MLLWNASRVAGYGEVPGYRPVALGTTGSLADKYSWRNRASESVGYVWMGANWYDPETAQFLAHDAEGFERGESIAHNAFGGNPIGFSWDGDGRCPEQTGFGTIPHLDMSQWVATDRAENLSPKQIAESAAAYFISIMIYLLK